MEGGGAHDSRDILIRVAKVVSVLARRRLCGGIDSEGCYNTYNVNQAALTGFAVFLVLKRNYR